MKKIIKAIMLIATVFSVNAQTVDPDFKDKCDKILDAIQDKVDQYYQTETMGDFSNIASLIRTAFLDPNYTNQWDAYVELSVLERNTPLCVVGSIISYINCQASCCPAWINPQNPNGHVSCYPQCSTCQSNLQTSVLGCFFEPKPSPSK